MKKTVFLFLLPVLILGCTMETHNRMTAVSNPEEPAPVNEKTLNYNDVGVSIMENIVKPRGLQFADYDLLAGNWTTPDIPGKLTSDYLFEVQYQNQEAVSGFPYTKDIVERSINYHNAGTLEAIDKGFIPTEPQYEGLGSRAHEWGYSRFHLHGVTDGSGREIEDPHYLQIPFSRGTSYQWLYDFLYHNYVGEGHPRPWFSMNGHFPYHHYAAEFGFDVLGSEIGENINNYQMLLAFNRGAAREYGKPWFVDVSAWHSGGITDYSDFKVWGDASGPNRGHSLSLYRRSYFMSYMAGADAVAAEAGAVNFFYDTDPINVGGEDVLRLSPLGEVGKEFYNFTLQHPDPGVPYTPFAVYLDHGHGTYIGNGAIKRAYNFFLYNSGDHMSWWLFHMLYPNGWDITASGNNESGTMVGSYHGDLYDVVLQNATTETLSKYPAVIMSGDIDLTSSENEYLRQYVANGGILVMNSAYMDQLSWVGYGVPVSPLSFCVKNYGSGTVLLYGSDYHAGTELSNILYYLDEGLTPFSVSCDNGREIEYLINRKPDSWVVTLINNAGVTKTPESPAQIHPEQVITATVTSRRGDIVSSNSWMGSFSGSSDNRSLTTTIEPGGIAIIEIAL